MQKQEPSSKSHFLSIWQSSEIQVKLSGFLPTSFSREFAGILAHFRLSRTGETETEKNVSKNVFLPSRVHIYVAFGVMALYQLPMVLMG